MSKKYCKCGYGKEIVLKAYHKKYNLPNYIRGYHLKDKVWLENYKKTENMGMMC